jgi:hypothetical protein
MRKNIWCLSFSVWLTSLIMMISSSTHFPTNDIISFFLWLNYNTCHILSQKGNTNENHPEISCHPRQNGYHQENGQQILVRIWRKRNSYIHCQWGYKLVQPLWKSLCKFLKKPKIELLHDATIPLLSIYLEHICRNIGLHTHVVCSIC